MQAAVRSLTSKLFGRYLLATNVVSGIGLASFGDYLKQKILISQGHSDAKGVDADQSLKMGLASMPLSVEMHFWYKWLDRRFPSKAARNVLRKVFLDEVVMAPILTTTLIAAFTALERKDLEEFKFRMSHSFFLLYLADVSFYAPIQCLNFYFFPTKYRTIVVYVASVVYFSVASYAVHEFANKWRRKNSTTA